MAIAYPLTLPTVNTARRITFRQVNAGALSQSPFTFKQQAVLHTGQRWEADVSLPPMSRAQAAQWIGFLASLKGISGTLLMGDPSAPLPRGSAGGTPLVMGADQTGGELLIDGATANQTGWLLVGDYIQLGAGGTVSLHMVLADVDTDGSGQATLDLWPNIRSAPGDNDALTLIGTVGIWRQSTNTVSWDVDSASIFGMSFTLVEAIQ
ncbi:MAG: hypothetical protein JKY54_08120 [Flavobacteriales bacterium]|nr:hypothetical protein [Flavobacteriales bacterium]